jgi:hypothetical protein
LPNQAAGASMVHRALLLSSLSVVLSSLALLQDQRSA